ncbi:MAG: nitroreductase [Gammaproteobacteria bacterium]|nr:nitroreductase [Gammaproteobacteria bacterium]
MNELLQLLKRHSTPAKVLAEPAPDDEQLRQILEIAMHAPDHGRIYPYRFITIRGDARHELSRVFGEAVKRRDPDVSSDYLKKQMDKPLRSPLIVVVIASLIESPKIPEIEQMLCAGAAAHNILLASNAMGFGSIWLTGDNAYDTHVESALGLAGNEQIIGFIYLGSEEKELPSPQKPGVSDRISQWP